MSIQIDNTNRIILNGRYCGLAVVQRATGTLVYTPESLGQKYIEHKMPQVRYSTAHDSPASGVAGRSQFEADLRGLLSKLS